VATDFDSDSNLALRYEELRRRNEILQQELAEAQKELNNAHLGLDRFQSALNLANIGYWECDLSSQEFIFNDGIYKVYRTDINKMGTYRVNIVDYTNKFVHPADREWVGKNIQRSLTSFDPDFHLEHRVIFGDGSEGVLMVSFQLVRNEAGQPILQFGVCQDITSLKRREYELRRFAAILEQANDFVAIIDTEGRPNYLNPAGRSLLGIRDPHLEQISIGSFFPETSQAHLEEIIAKTIKEGAWSGETVFLKTTGETVPVLLVLLTHRDLDGSIAFISAIARDLTPVKLAEEALRQNIAQEEQLRAQQATLRELSTPLIPLSDELVIMPIVGTIDSSRAQQIIEVLLEGINTHGSETAILDITGVKVIDTQVANALLRAAQAARLLGSQVILTGISPEVAQTLVHLSIDLDGIITHRDLRDSFSHLFS
jgi:rsbT co-antagonist protein RsbR